MAIDPATAKILTQLALRAAADEEARKRIIMIALIPVISVLLILTMFVYIITHPLEYLSTIFSGNELAQVTQLHDSFSLDQTIDINDASYRESNGIDYSGVTFLDGAINVVYFNQADKRWADKPYGKTGTIGTSGCGPTSLAMMVSSLSDYEDIKEEMLECISQDEKDMADFAFLCRDVKIAVVGAAHKVGTTTTAFNLVNFLVNSGADAAYVEANTNDHISTLPTYYKEMTVRETHAEYNGVKYYFRGHFPEENNFIAIDFGTLAQCSLKTLRQCELLILCGTTKPYELDFVRAALAERCNMPLFLLLSYTPKKVQSEICNMLKNKNVQLYFTGYSTDLFDGKANAAIYAEIVKEYTHVNAIE